jgi:hypothetical protein
VPEVPSTTGATPAREDADGGCFTPPRNMARDADAAAGGTLAALPVIWPQWHFGNGILRHVKSGSSTGASLSLQ